MDHLPVASVGLNQAASDNSLHLPFGNQTVGIGSGDRFPEIVHDNIFNGFPNQDVGGQSDGIGCNYFCVRHVIAAFDDVLQFPNISRVVVSEQLLHRIGRHDALLTAVRIQRFDDVAHQERDVRRALSKRRDVDRKYVEAVEQVFSELARTRQRPKVTVSGSDDPGVDWPVNNVTEPTHLLLLKHPEKLHLESFGRVRNFIQE